MFYTGNSDYSPYGRRFAGISNQFRVPDLRHTALTHIVDQSRDIISAKDIAGHSEISVTEFYVHATREKLRQAIEKIPY